MKDQLKKRIEKRIKSAHRDLRMYLEDENYAKCLWLQAKINALEMVLIDLQVITIEEGRVL